MVTPPPPYAPCPAMLSNPFKWSLGQLEKTCSRNPRKTHRGYIPLSSSYPTYQPGMRYRSFPSSKPKQRETKRNTHKTRAHQEKGESDS
jgi:hypothetical protein